MLHGYVKDTILKLVTLIEDPVHIIFSDDKTVIIKLNHLTLILHLNLTSINT